MNEKNRTKIVATLGPASSSKAELKRMFEAGVSVCRINFSHGTYQEHKLVIDYVRELNKELNNNVAILADLQGPKLRIGDVEKGGVTIVEGQIFYITTDKCIGTKNKAYMTYKKFPKDVKVGDKVLIDDGKLLLEVIDTNRDNLVTTKVLYGGELKSKKGVNLPNTKISLPSLTEKDLQDLDYALSQNVNWIGLSFVRTAEDIHNLRKRILAVESDAKIIAKIEKPEALENIDAIIEATDGVMVARGDLGVEIPLQDVPTAQKRIVKKCYKAGRPVIIATQMMESMIDGFRPTRAEVNDVANSVLDGADAVMLSGETSVGIHPHKVIQTMASIIKKVEESDAIYNKEYEPDHNDPRFISNSICYTACEMIKRVHAKAIVAMTTSGYTPIKLSSQRPKAHIYVFTQNRQFLDTLNLVWGVQAFYYNKYEGTDETIADVTKFLKAKKYLKKGDLFINIGTMPLKDLGKTNMLKLSRVE